MGGGFGGCTINLVKDDIYDKFVEDVTAKFTLPMERCMPISTARTSILRDS